MEEPSIPYNYTTFLDKSGKLIKKTGYFFKENPDSNDIQSGKFYVEA